MAHPDPREALRHAMAHEHRLYHDVRRHERLAERWQQRAELALRRGEQALAREALDREAAERRLVQEYEGLYLAQSQAIRKAKQRLPAHPAPAPSVEDRLRQLADDDRLDRDLAELKARLTSS